MVISFYQLLVWIIIALFVGVIAELLAHRRAPSGVIGATVIGFLAILLLVGVLHIALPGDLRLNGVPIITSILVAALFILLWSRFAYHRVRPYASRYYHRVRPYASRSYWRRGSYVRRPRKRERWF